MSRIILSMHLTFLSPCAMALKYEYTRLGTNCRTNTLDSTPSENKSNVPASGFRGEGMGCITIERPRWMSGNCASHLIFQCE